MVRHIVMFRLGGSEEERNQAALRFRKALEALPAVIPQLISMEVGVNINPAESWHVVLTATLPSLEDVAVYSAHPAHVAAAALIAPLKLDRAAVDYTF